MFSFKNYKLKNFNIGLLLCVIALCILGYMVLSSALVNYADRDGNLKRQLLGMILGGVIMIFLTVTDYHFWLKFHWVIYAFFLLLLGLLFTHLGVNLKGATRWLDLPVVGLGICQSRNDYLFCLVFSEISGKTEPFLHGCAFPAVVSDSGGYDFPGAGSFHDLDVYLDLSDGILCQRNQLQMDRRPDPFPGTGRRPAVVGFHARKPADS